jgi:hypothetical protein
LNAGSVFANGLGDVGHTLEVVELGGIFESVQVLVNAVRSFIGVGLEININSFYQGQLVFSALTTMNV